MKFAITLIIVLVLLALIIFPEFRKKLKVLIGGFLNIFVEDAAKTPEGAAAVFSQAIEQAQDQYNKSAETLNKLSGELIHTKNAVTKINRDLQDTEATCERLVKAGNMRDAEVYSSRRIELMNELKQKQDYIAKLEPMVKEATQIHDACGKKLLELKRNKKETIEKMKMNVQMKDLLGDLDELKKDTATAKMLDVVMDGSSDLQKEVDGARIVHENKTSTKIARAEQNAAQLRSDEYLESLKKKYNGGN